MFIKHQGVLERRNYVDRDGEPRVMESMGFILSDGVDTFYAEMTGKDAAGCGTLALDALYLAQTTMDVSSWETQNHTTAYMTRIRINRLRKFG